MASKTNTGLDFALTDLYLYLVDSCNLTCAHCWIAPRTVNGPQTGIPLEPLKRAVAEAVPLGLQRIKLTGGEPLLYEDLQSLLDFARQRNLYVSLETNGTLLSQVAVQMLVDAGVVHVSVSLDAADPELHDRLRGARGCFELTRKGVERLVEQGLRPEVIMAVGRLNREGVPDLIHLARSWGAGSVKINPLLPCGRGTEAFAKGLNLDLAELMDLQALVRAVRSDMGGFHVCLDLPPAFLPMDEILKEGIATCRILNILGVLANGDISLCGIGWTRPDLRMGNIRTEALPVVWEENAILEKLRNGLPHQLQDVCGTCIFRFHCLGSCRANAYALDGDLFAPYFLCRDLDRAGLFPESRRVA